MMNITENGLKEYIEAFYQELNEKASMFLDSDAADMVYHRALLPANIICHVSTQFGVAIEYIKAEKTSIKSVKGSARVEDLLVNSPSKLKSSEPILLISYQGIKILGGTLEGAFPFRLNNINADVTFSDVKFTAPSLGWKKSIYYAEIYGNRDANRWSITSAQSRAKDEILSALFDVKQAEKQKIELHEYIKSSKEKNVLVLGSYNSHGKKRINKISKILADLGYNPILIENIPDFEHYDIPQKVTTIGALSRFVVIDDSIPSGHLMEVEICKLNRWVTILFRADGEISSFMTMGASNTSNVILEKEFNSNEPRDDIVEAASWAESKLLELEKKLNDQFPWRSKS